MKGPGSARQSTSQCDVPDVTHPGPQPRMSVPLSQDSGLATCSCYCGESIHEASHTTVCSAVPAALSLQRRPCSTVPAAPSHSTVLTALSPQCYPESAIPAVPSLQRHPCSAIPAAPSLQRCPCSAVLTAPSSQRQPCRADLKAASPQQCPPPLCSSHSGVPSHKHQGSSLLS